MPQIRCLLPLVLAACATPDTAEYFPGGADVDKLTRARYRDAVDLERAGKSEEALAAFDALCRAHPIRIGLHLHRLRLARSVRGPEYAASLYDPPPPGVDAERAGILSDLARIPGDEPARAKAILEYATSREPGEPFWRLCLADLGVSTHDLVITRARNERLLGQVQAEARSLAEARHVLDRARKEALRSVDLDPELAEGHLMLGYIETRAADLAKDADERDGFRNTAMVHYQRAIEIDPQSLEARIDLAENYLYFDTYAKAARQLEIAARLAPLDARVWNNLGFTYHAVGQLDDAIGCYRRAIRFDPSDVRARVALADCERRRGNTGEAVKQLRQARAESAGDDEMLALIAFKLAAIYEFEGQYREAIEEYERYIQLGGKESAKARSRVRHIFEHAFE